MTLVGFVGTSASARFIEGLSDRDPIMPDDDDTDPAPEHVDPDGPDLDVSGAPGDRDDPEVTG